MTTKRTNRRRFIKGAGAAGVVALAGCSGDGGNGNGNGNGNAGGNGNGNGNGSGNGNGESTQTQQSELTEVSFVYPPWPGLPSFNYIVDQTDILENKLNEHGYTIGNITRSWDDTTLFMAGKVDMMPTSGGAEAAQMAMARDIDLTVHAQAATNYEGWYVREGSDLDPANTGSAQASIQKVIDEERPYGHPGLNQGVIWPESAMWHNRFDISFGPETEHPLNLKESDWFTLPKLLTENEEVDMIVNAPPLGMVSTLVQDDPGVVDIGWCQPEVEAAGLSPRTLNLGGFVTRTEFSENHEGAMVAWMDAWTEGVKWARNPDNWDDILSKEENWQYFSANTREEAEYNLRFSYAENPSEEEMLDTENPLPVILSDIELNEKRIDQYMEAIRYMEETGAIQSDAWEDRLSFKPLSI